MRLLLLIFALSRAIPGEIVYPRDSRALSPIIDFASVAGRLAVLHEDRMALSADEGVTWVNQKVPSQPRSICFADATRAWLVSAEGVHATTDAGRTWRRVLKSKDLLRCAFLSAAHGYAVGNRKIALETTDGGRNWHRLEAATGLLSDPERTSFTGVEFSGSTGFISGFHSPKRPAQDTTGRQWPQLGVLIQTVDGGQTWKPTSAAIFGRLATARVAGRSAALVLQFDYQFDWLSEVFLIDLPTGETGRAYRESGRRVCGIALLPGGRVAVAAVAQRNGQDARARPLEVRLDGEAVAVDEILTASRCFLERGGTNLWLATDQGMVEKLDVP